jgi:hypothetical protein
MFIYVLWQPAVSATIYFLKKIARFSLFGCCCARAKNDTQDDFPSGERGETMMEYDYY